MVSAKLCLKDGIRTQNIVRICLNKDGQKKNQTNLMKLHLQKGDDGRRTGALFFFKTTERKQGPIRQRPDFREAKQAHRQLYKEHAESTGEGIHSIHPSTPSKTKLSTISDQQVPPKILSFRGVQLHGFTLELDWKYNPSTSSSSSSQWQQHDDWKSNQSWDYWLSSTWTEQAMFFLVEIKGTGGLVARCDSDCFSSCSGSFFSLAGNFQFPANHVV